MLQTGIASVSVSKHREGAGEGDGGMLPLAAGDRELLAQGSVPRGILQESPASPAHQGLEVALRVRWRSFMNELSRALGMKCRHKQAVLFFFFFSSPALSGVSVYAEEDTQRRMRREERRVLSCIYVCTNVASPLRQLSCRNVTLPRDKAGILLHAGLKGEKKTLSSLFFQQIKVFQVRQCSFIGSW